ncbi:4Fe-4S binding protein [Iningainema tapete]|uniref:4Fe-4S binding protein n=1 Tax=Iningainema tapete BLCC-T55 TaxID=2748662 RepID=A0A8J6XJ30_9CYAN|nr:4Fe-4S binding protein [Iningainema tapete]MBD2777800.1 4Fe-4S binding protein [Iningainema tapete BLCC-T55]
MAYKITSECISCNVCLSACPTGAVKVVEDRVWIDPNLCTNCVGSVYTVAQCKAVCPTSNGCVKQPADYWEGWFTTYNRLIAKLTKKQNYWDKWYESYSQKFSEQLSRRQGAVHT